MPSKEQHLAQAGENELFFSSIDLTRGQLRGWAITALFYSGLHYVDAYLAMQGAHPSSHSRRTYLVEHEATWQTMYAEYHELKERSEDARHNVVQFDEATVQNLYQNAFAMIKGTLLPLI